MHEFLYPLLQAYDSVALACDIELGGTDQLFNLLVGRDLMPRYGVPAQMVMTTLLLEGTDARVVDGKIVGDKMSKSADNYVGVSEPPLEMFKKLMLVDDQVIWRYFELLSSRSNEEIAALRADVAAGRANDVIERQGALRRRDRHPLPQRRGRRGGARPAQERRGRPGCPRTSRRSTSPPRATPSGSARRWRSPGWPSRPARARVW